MESIVSFIRQHQRFVAVSHLNPDGDSIGSLSALALGLRSLGKEIDVLSSDPVPFAYCRLPGVSAFQITPKTVECHDAAILLECSGQERTGIRGLERNPLIVIDHHMNCRADGLLNWIDPGFGAVGQMILRLLEALQVPITAEIATNLYAALLTDTGSFQFGNTTACELRDAARLTEYGANPGEIAEMVFNANRAGKVLLLGKVLSRLRLEAGERLAWIVMDRKTMETAGALPEDTEGIINHLMSIHTVQLAAFFKQDGEDNRFRVSLRSKGCLDVSDIARQFSGGGHRNAAGFTVHQALESGVPMILNKLCAFLGEDR